MTKDEEIRRLRWWLQHIRDIANCSEGVEFYAMLATKGLELHSSAAIENASTARGSKP